jgi:hypothetical protein
MDRMGLMWLGEERVQGDPRGPAGPPYFRQRIGSRGPATDQWLVNATARAISALMPGTMLLASVFSSSR